VAQLNVLWDGGRWIALVQDSLLLLLRDALPRWMNTELTAAEESRWNSTET
jgi:hypothetical protein